MIARPVLIGAAVVGAIALGCAAVQTIRIEGLNVWPIKVEGYAAKVERLQTRVHDLEGAAKLSETRRANEQATAVQSFEGATERCETRVTNAREVGRIIEEITNGPSEPAVDGRRIIVGADKLRSIIGEGAGGKGGSLPDGGADPIR